MENGFKIGVLVKLKKTGSFPRLMCGSIQKVIDVRVINKTPQVRIERQHRNRTVSRWIEVTAIERLVSPDEIKVADACAAHAPRTPYSAQEYFDRGWCHICREREKCKPYQGRRGKLQ